MVSHRPLAALVAEHPMFEGVGADIVELLSGCARNVAFADGDLLAREGEISHAFHLLRSGRVALEAVMPGRGRAIVQTLDAGDFVGQDWLVPPYTADFDARAMGPVRAIAFDADCLRGKCEADPRIGYELLKRFVPRLLDRLKTMRLQSLDLYGPRRRAPEEA